MVNDEDRKQPVEVTREELYRQVWETPLSRLAERYGISGTGLAKVCDRLKIPYPPRGYWAKKAAGKRVARYRLPEADENTLRRITITPNSERPTPQKLLADAREQAEQVRAKPGSITVPERLVRPHAILARWRADRERRTQEARRERDPWMKRLKDPGDFSQVDRRRHRILDALFKELERRGGRVKESERGELYVELQGERIEFQLREKQKQVRRPLNDEERRWSSSTDRSWKQELQPTGKLLFAIKTYLEGKLRAEWLETDKAPMETLLADIVATLVAAGPLLMERRRRREEEQQQYRIAEQRRQQERNRWRRFIETAHQWREARIAREFLDALKLKVTNSDPLSEIDGKTASEWIAWAEARLVQADPLNRGVDAIFREVAEVTAWTYRD